MTSEEMVKADEVLERLFRVVLEEARARPEFAERLISALPKAAIVKVERTQAKKKRDNFDPNAFSLVAVLEREGEKGLRQRLNPFRSKDKLRAIAEAQHIPLNEAARRSKATVKDIRDAIIEGVKFRIADRLAAAS